MRPGKRIVTLTFLAAALLLTAGILFTYSVGSVSVRSARQMAHQRLVITRLDEFLSTTKDVETGQRGYLLTGEEPYLEPYKQGVTRVQLDLSALQELAKVGDLRLSDVDMLRQLTEKKLVELDRTMRLRREGGLEAALPQVRTGLGREFMEDIRSQIARMRTQAERELDVATSLADRTRVWRSEAFIGVGLINLGFLSWALRRLGREMHNREAAMLDATRQKESLRTTLESIGDAVIATDSQGHVTFLNREAERLTGWSEADAQDKPLSEVFHIINEETRVQAEDPVNKVLRVGSTVGLANHTLLLSRAGKLTPIDDSAAPIRQAPGEPLFGVVLVFRDVSVQRQAQEELRRARDELAKLNSELEERVQSRTQELEKANEQLNEFCYSVAHDLRAPLRAQLAFARLLQEEFGSTLGEQGRDYARRIADAAARQGMLVSDLLSHMSLGRSDLPLEPIKLKDALEKVLADLALEIEKQKATLDTSGLDVSVLANRSSLHLVLSNLLSNAIKFVHPETPPIVRLQAEPREGLVRLWVADNGVGIEPQYQTKLFGVFQRLHPKSDYPGTGMGLAIVKRAIERMGGSVGAESQPGKGSRFWVDFKPA